MPIKTKRWDDPREPDDGFRLLICRYRPRALKKELETWDKWEKELGPSKELHADFYGKHGEPIGWKQYRRRYLKEMKDQKERIADLARLNAWRKLIEERHQAGHVRRRIRGSGNEVPAAAECRRRDVSAGRQQQRGGVITRIFFCHRENSGA